MLLLRFWNERRFVDRLASIVRHSKTRPNLGDHLVPDPDPRI